jgi:hypothetical protein
MAGGGRRIGALAALLVFALAGPSCSTDDPLRATADDTSESADDQWVVSDEGGGVVIEAPTYRLDVSWAGVVSIQAVQGRDDPAVVDGVDLYVERDGGREVVREVTDVKAGLDHVTLFVSFADGTTGRVEMGAATSDTVAVSVSADDRTGVTDAGIELEPADVEGTYHLRAP